MFYYLCKLYYITIHIRNYVYLFLDNERVGITFRTTLVCIYIPDMYLTGLNNIMLIDICIFTKAVLYVQKLSGGKVQNYLIKYNIFFNILLSLKCFYLF